MSHPQRPRGRNAKAPPLQIEQLLPEKVRIGTFAYNPRTRQYHSLTRYNVKLIVRSEREMDRLWALIDAVARNTAAWQD